MRRRFHLRKRLCAPQIANQGARKTNRGAHAPSRVAVGALADRFSPMHENRTIVSGARRPIPQLARCAFSPVLFKKKIKPAGPRVLVHLPVDYGAGKLPKWLRLRALQKLAKNP